jgi:hypothetical protein
MLSLGKTILLLIFFIFFHFKDINISFGTDPAVSMPLIAAENTDTNVGISGAPMTAPIVADNKTSLMFKPRSGTNLYFIDMSTKLPRNGPCIMFDSLEITAIILNNESETASFFVLTPDGLIEYDNVSIKFITIVKKQTIKSLLISTICPHPIQLK